MAKLSHWNIWKSFSFLEFIINRQWIRKVSTRHLFFRTVLLNSNMAIWGRTKLQLPSWSCSAQLCYTNMTRYELLAMETVSSVRLHWPFIGLKNYTATCWCNTALEVIDHRKNYNKKSRHLDIVTDTHFHFGTRWAKYEILLTMELILNLFIYMH